MMDILLILNKEEKTIKAVKEIEEKGNLQTVSPNKVNQFEFMKFDGHKSIAKNFLSTLWRQIKNLTQSGDELMNRYKVEPRQSEQTQEEKPQFKQDLSADTQPQTEIKQHHENTIKGKIEIYLSIRRLLYILFSR